MDLKIGVINTTREIELELDDDHDLIESETAKLEQALANGARMIWFTDKKGRRVGVVADKLAYVQFEGEPSSRMVGFSG